MDTSGGNKKPARSPDITEAVPRSRGRPPKVKKAVNDAEPNEKIVIIPGLDLLMNEDQVEANTVAESMIGLDDSFLKGCSVVEKKSEVSTPSQECIVDPKQIAEDSEGTTIRRSSRIKSLETQRGGRGRRREVVFSGSSDASLSRSMPNLNDDDSNSNSSSAIHNNSGWGSPNRDSSSGISSSASTPNISSFGVFGGSIFPSSGSSKPLKVKSRWRYSSDAESLKGPGDGSLSVDSMSLAGSSVFGSCSSLDQDNPSASDADSLHAGSDFEVPTNLIKRSGHLMFDPADSELIDKIKKFQGIEDSIFRTERKISKESKGMVCDCFLTNEEIDRGEIGCNEDCLNRLLMVECGVRCSTGDRCTNKRFQKKEYCTLEVFKTEKKGHGLRTLHGIPEGGFVIEYVGEVLDPTQFEKRTKEYAKGNLEHFYFMALKSDAIIDATVKGNCSRFINHSCEPNCETQKWTVNGELRIGFFTLRDLRPGDEIVFDYQFQRYGKQAQRCYCMTPSCRGWIGEEDDEEEDLEDKEDDKEDEVDEIVEEEAEVMETECESSEVEPKKVKKKPKAVRKKRKDTRILEDVALEEELVQLERTGLKNRHHTLTLSRLMVRAEKWDDRERILNILINGDPPCRRLFLDYRGLKLIHNWMINLPIPSNDAQQQLIKNEEYHQLFLKALLSLPIPNKTLLLDSKIISLVETWSTAPSETEISKSDSMHLPVTQATSEVPELTDDVPPGLQIVKDADRNEIDSLTSMDCNTDKVSLEIADVLVKMEIDSSDSISKVEKEVQETTTELNMMNWKFVEMAKSLLESWVELKEVFRIPKKERVQQMKEHEMEADKGLALGFSSNSSFGSNSYSYDRDGRSKWSTRNGRDRRVTVIDSYNIHRHPLNRIQIQYPNLSKEERRSMFAAKVAQEEEDMKQRKMQEEIVALHQNRCSLLGLDPCTTPVVDVSGHYFLDPNTIEWKLIKLDDPTLPSELLLLVQAALCPAPTAAPEIEDGMPGTNIKVLPFEFPPWPEGLPPPPPFPTEILPDGWKMTVDDEGRCYYYDVITRQSQWDPPTAIVVKNVEDTGSGTSGSSGTDEEPDIPEEVVPPVVKIPIQTLRTRLMERAERRKKSGLVQERIISPRMEEQKPSFPKSKIRENKLQVLQEKIKERADAKSKSEEPHQMEDSPILATVVEEEIEVTHGPTEAADAEPMPSPPAKKSKSEVAIDDTDVLSQSTETDEEQLSPISSSPIETELDISLAAAAEENSDSFLLSSPAAADDSANKIPGLGVDPRDHQPGTSSSAKVIAKKDRNSKREKKQKSIVYKKSPKLVVSEKSKEVFRGKIAHVVIAHLNPYRKPDVKSGRIISTEDFKHLARKMTHGIMTKELKHIREGKSLEVTESIKVKTKEYVKKYMARFANSNYARSPEDKHVEGSV